MRSKIENIKDFQDIIIQSEDITNIDAENINLSKIPELDNPSILNSNLHNTYLKIKIRHHNCIVSSDLRGTKLTIEPDKDIIPTIRINDVLLDQTQIDYLNKASASKKAYIKYDYKTLMANSSLVAPFLNTLEIIKEQLNFNEATFLVPGLSTQDELKEQVKTVETIIEKSNCKALILLYENIKDQMTDYEKINMFTKHSIVNKTFHDLTIDSEIYDCLRYFTIYYSNFKNIIFDLDAKTFFNEETFSPRDLEIDKVENISFPTYIKSDLKTLEGKRLSDTPFTIRHNLYIELGRQCNANCSFCRNSCMLKEHYNLNGIKKTLENIKNWLNNIYIGGGEPTLRINDLKKLINDGYTTTIITNGTLGLKELYKCTNNSIFRKQMFKDQNYMISRHSYDDYENAKIFGLSPSDFVPLDEIVYFKKPTLACTCIKNGMDSPKKILEYIRFAMTHNIDSILFTNLQEDASVTNDKKNNISINIDPNVFNEVIQILKDNAWIQDDYSIISNSGYELITLKSNHIFSYLKMTVRFKRYVSKKELDILWQHAVKRTFDLSISPSGKLYDDWSETTSKTLKKR